MKKMISLLVIMSLFLTACGSEKGGDTNSTKGENKAKTENTETKKMKKKRN